MSNFLILMSGGTTPVINATLVGIVEKIMKTNKKVYSGLPGLEGVLTNRLINLTELHKKKLSRIESTPGSHFIGTTRLKRLTESEIKLLEKILIKKNISNIINIGGNGTLKQTIDLSKRLPSINFASCPKTVDNDLGDLNFKQVLYNPGFISCIKIWNFFLQMINIENTGACSHDKIIISQTFGRDTGFICGSIRYWDKKYQLPLMLLLPEDRQNFSKIYSRAMKIISKYGRLMIFISEGYKVGNIKPVKDKSGQIMYGSSGSTNAQILNNKFISKGIQSRIFNPTILQRVFKYDKKNIDDKDIKIAKKIGNITAKMLLNKRKSFLASINKDKKVILIDYLDCKNFSRKMPKKFILKNKFDVSKKYIEYLSKVMK